MRQCPYDKMQVWDAEGTGSIQFRAHEVHQSDLGSIVENSVISSALHQGLSEQSNLTYFAPFNLTSVKRDESDTLLIGSEDGSAVRAKLLVAADGANSRIRQLAGFATREWDYGHDAIVTTVQTEKPHGQLPGSVLSIPGRWHSCRWREMGSSVIARSSGRW